MSMHKGICGQSEGGASCKQRVAPGDPEGFSEKTLADYIQRRYREEAFNTVKAERECCGNPLRGCKNCPPVKTQVLQKPKLAFEEWYSQQFPHGNYYSQETIDYFKVIWKAAQENCR